MLIKRTTKEVYAALFGLVLLFFAQNLSYGDIIINQDSSSVTYDDSYIPNNTNPTGAIHVYLNPSGYVGPIAAPSNDLKVALNNTLQGWQFDYVGKGSLSGTLKVVQYDAQIAAPLGANQAGAALQLEYTPGANDPPLASLHWIQLVNDSVAGKFVSLQPISAIFAGKGGS